MIRAAGMLLAGSALGLALLAPAGEDVGVVEFVDVTGPAGLRWGIRRLAPRGWNLVETMGGGGGFVDYDGDGWLDVYLVSYSTEEQPGGRVDDALFRNQGDGTFREVTRRAGLAGVGRGMGLAVGDYDGDGWPDLYVTGFGRGRLWRNRGDGTFADVTERAGVANAGRWGVSAVFFDMDADGDLDLFVANYLDVDPEGPLACQMIEDRPFCSIDRFRGSPSVLYRNEGEGRFTDVSARAGLAKPGKGLGVLAADLDGDGRIDLFQANDTAPNFLWRNNGDGTFTDVGLEAEVAYDASGRALGAMGLDADDWDQDGRLEVFVANFTHQSNSFFRNTGRGRFVEMAGTVGLAAPSLLRSGFGTRFLDYDNDGNVDLFVLNGHPFEPVEKVWPGITYREPPLLFERTPGGFREVAAERGAALRRRYAGRGLALGDYDNDGDPDLLLLCVGEPPVLLRNEGGNRNHWLGVRLMGAPSSRSAVGARVSVTAGGRTRWKPVLGGGSYASASDLRLLFGLGAAARAERVEVRWPRGAVQTLTDVPAGRYVTLQEPRPVDPVVPGGVP